MTEETAPLLEPELLAKLGALRVRSRGRVSGALVGKHRSKRHGSSVEFAEHKEYSPGDDTRRLDWKAYAKVDRYYIKQFEDETNLRAYLVLDSSGSMGYGEGNLRKLRHGSRLAAALAFLLLREQDSVGLIAFRDETTHYAPPRGEKGYLNELNRNLRKLIAEGETQIQKGLQTVLEVARQRSLVVIISDLFETGEEYLQTLAQISKRHEVAVLHVLHEDELTFPFERMHIFREMEGDGELIAEPSSVRDSYLKEMTAFLHRTKTFCANHGIRYHQIQTGEAIDRQLSVLLSEVA